MDLISEKPVIGQSQAVQQQEIIPNYQSFGGEEIGKLMLDSSSLIKKIRLQLQGYSKNEHGIYVKVGEQLVNDKGIAALIVLVESLAVKETYLTKITDGDAVRIIRDLWNNIISLIVKNKNEWDLPEDKGKWTLIRIIIVNPVYFALRRGVDGVEKHFFADTHKSSTVSNSQMSQQYPRRGLFGG